MDIPSPIAEPVNHRVRNFLRAIIVLAFAGLFVAGALSASKVLDLSVPCGPSHGCDTVNNHASSKWFGVPVAYVGFLGYVLIAVLAVLRSGMKAAKARSLALGGYLLSAFGAITSVALQLYSLTVIKATCLWCLGSAAIMVLLLVFHALEYGDRVSEDVPDGKGEFMLAIPLFFAVVLGLGVFTNDLMGSGVKSQIVPAAVLEQNKLVPDDAHIYGDKNAPVTIVEFADLLCPVCQRESPKMKEWVAKRYGKVRLVYRHLPLTEIHPMALLTAAMSESAAEEGKFWEFATAVMATGEELKTPERVDEVARSAGLDPEKLKARLQDDKGAPTMRLTRDINAAGALGITMTPTFIVQVKGMETQAYGHKDLMRELEKGKYSKLVGPAL